MNTPALDDMLLRSECAEWLRLSERELSAKCQGSKPSIPVFRINRAVVRFHPRTIIAKFAKDAGIPLEVMAASMGIIERK